MDVINKVKDLGSSSGKVSEREKVVVTKCGTV